MLQSIDNPGGEVAGLTTEVGSGILLDKVTAPLLVSPIPGSRLAYGVINFGGGVVSNYAAQKLRGEEDINYGCLLYTSPSPRDRG